jgi:hypothetical protein
MPTAVHDTARRPSRTPAASLLDSLAQLLRAIIEAVAEAQQMRRDAQRRYPHLMFDR